MAHPLRTHRESKNPKQSQEDLAKELGVSRITVVRWENGERVIDEGRLPEVSRITGIPRDQLRPDLVEKLKRLIGSVQ